MTIQSVFLSYGRKDDEPFVREIWQYLTDKGIKAWFDRENLPARGEAFTNEIARGIEASERLILFVGAHSANSEWCEREWKHALKNCIPIVVVLVQHTFDAKPAPDGSPTTSLPDGIKNKFPAELFDVNGLEFPPNMRQNAPEKLYNLLTNAENLPLADITFGESLPTHYINRPNYLRDMKIVLGVGDRTSKQATKLAGYQGIGGIGKTILASALVHECDTRRTFDYIFWLTLGETATSDDATGLLYRIGEFFGDKNDEYLELDKARLAVERHLRNHRTLIVLDDAWKDTQDLIRAFQFSTIDCNVLITTRSLNLLNTVGARVISVEKLTTDEGLALLSTVKQYADDAERAIYTEILGLLDGHALAVQIIAQQLHDYDADGVLRRLKKNLQEANPFADLQLGDDDRNASLERSLQISYGDLGGDNPTQKADLQRRFRALGVFAVNSRYGLNPLKTMWGDADEDDAEDYAVKLRHVGLLNRIGGNYIRFGHHVLLTTYARALLMRAGEYERLFNQYADFYTGQAKEIFDLPPQDWHDKKDGINADDIANIRGLGAGLMHQTANGQVGDLRRALEFATMTRRYVTDRMEERAWAWLEMGLSAVQVLRKEAPADEKLMHRQSVMLGELGTVYKLLGQMGKSLSYQEQSLPLIRVLGDKTNEATTLSNLGSVYDALGQKEKALAYYEQALPIRREVGDRRGKATTLNNMGLVYDALGQKEKALAYYEQALPIMREVGDRGGEATMLNNIGLVYDDLGQKEQALAYYEQVLPIYRAVGDKGGEATTLNNMGSVYDDLGQKEQALAYYEQALPIMRAVGDRGGEATTLNNIGAMYRAWGQLDKAVNYLLQSLAILESIGDAFGIFESCGNIGVTYDELNDVDNAITYLEKAFAIGTKINHPQLQAYKNYWMNVKRKRGDADVPPQQPQESEFDALIARLADIYKQAGEAGLRQMLTENNLPEAQIDEIVTVVVAHIAGAGGDDADESANMLPFETVREWVSNTYAVLKRDTHELENWRGQLDGAKMRMVGMGDDWANEVAFVEALLGVLRGEFPVLPAENPYHEAVRQLVEALKAG